MLTQSHVTTIVPVVNVDRARRFYEERLGLTEGRKTTEGGVHYETGDHSDFELSPRPEAPRNPYTVMTFEVSDVPREVRELESRGVTFEDYDLPELKTVDHVFTSGAEKCAWFRDPDGNILCIHSAGKGAQH